MPFLERVPWVQTQVPTVSVSWFRFGAAPPDAYTAGSEHMRSCKSSDDLRWNLSWWLPGPFTFLCFGPDNLGSVFNGSVEVKIILQPKAVQQRCFFLGGWGHIFHFNCASPKRYTSFFHGAEHAEAILRLLGWFVWPWMGSFLEIWCNPRPELNRSLLRRKKWSGRPWLEVGCGSEFHFLGPCIEMPLSIHYLSLSWSQTIQQSTGKGLHKWWSKAGGRKLCFGQRGGSASDIPSGNLT